MDTANHPTTARAKTLPRRAGELLEELRTGQPRIHAITNAAAQVFTANLLLAAGAVPSLTIAAGEVASFSSRAAALLINLGTLDAERCQAFPIAIKAAQVNRRPWVLDPVFVEASPSRLKVANDLLADKPAILRCNASEFLAISNTAGDVAILQVQEFALKHHLTIALTGAVDTISDGREIVRIHNGHPLMSRTTAMGCAGTALIAAFASLANDSLEAAAAALVVIGIAGEIAGDRADGPGTFPAHFLDALYSLKPATVETLARLS